MFDDMNEFTPVSRCEKKEIMGTGIISYSISFFAYPDYRSV